MELIRFCLDNVLAPMFGHDLDFIKCPMASSRDEAAASKSGASGRRVRAAARQKRVEAGDAMIDLSGPPLIEGLTSWIRFYRLIGFINLPRVPFYVALLYKICLVATANFVLLRSFVLPIVETRILASDKAAHNPIIIMMGFLMLAVSAINCLVLFYSTLFKLSPLFKLLASPKLCFIKRDIQAACGNKTLAYMLIFIVFQTLLLRAQVSRNFQEFIVDFELIHFLAEACSITVCLYYSVGLALVDFYVRFCFGAWLLALKCNLEYRTSRYNYLRAQLRGGAASARAPLSEEDVEAEERRVMRVFRQKYAFISLDEVQRSLNTMDDHLEVCRDVDTRSLVLITLNAFIGTGLIIMIAYNMLAKEDDAYHGAGMLVIALNNAVLVIFCYLGDSFLYFSLSAYVQAVEDEYFLQARGRRHHQNRRRQQCRCSLSSFEQFESAPQPPPAGKDGADKDDSSPCCLVINKQEVLFCRELLYQLENHLATPWSKLTFKSHMSMVVTFVELIAAQIIFDRQHG